MDKIEISDAIIIILRRKSCPFLDLFSNNFGQQISKSEFASCIRDLKTEKIIDYEGNFDDFNDIVLTRLGEEMIKKHGTFSKYLKSKNVETLYDRIIKWSKNNIIIVSLLIGFSVFAAIGTFTDSLKKIFLIKSVSIVSDSTTNSSLKADSSKITRPHNKLLDTINRTKQISLDKTKIHPLLVSKTNTIHTFESQLCNDVLLVINDLFINFKHIKGAPTTANSYSTSITLPGSVSNEITHFNDNFAFSSRFYKGTPTKAGATYEDLIDKLSCFGNPEAEIRESLFITRDINYNNVVIRIKLASFGKEQGVSLSIQKAENKQ